MNQFARFDVRCPWNTSAAAPCGGAGVGKGLGRLFPRSSSKVAYGGVWGLAGLVALAGTGRADDLFGKLAPTQPIPSVVRTDSPAPAAPKPAQAVNDVAAAEPAKPLETAPGYDLANFFPNSKATPLLASVQAPDEGPVTRRPVGCCDYPALVTEAQRSGSGHGGLGRTSVADRLPGCDGHTSMPGSRGRPHCRVHGNNCPNRPCPPAAPLAPSVPTMPGSPRPTPATPDMPPVDSLAPTQPQQAVPTTPVVPPATDVPTTAPQFADDAVPAIPDLQQALPPARALARADVGGLSSGLSRTPFLIGDGGGPAATGGRIALGRILITGEGLTATSSPRGFNSDTNGAQLNLVTDPAFNSVQSIAAARQNSSFTLPSLSLGGVAGTPPTTIFGLTGANRARPASPGLFQAAAQNAFETNPILDTATTGIAGEAQYVREVSGVLLNDNNTTYDAFLFYDYFVDTSIVFPGYAVGFVKLAENMSPLPRDRVYMNYSYFRNANFFGARGDVNRFMPGFEKTFYDGWTSVEIRTPFAGTFDSYQDIVDDSGTPELAGYKDIEFGNMSVIFKTLLWEQQTWAITAGMQVMLPTANNTSVYGPNTTGQNIQHVFVANESVHVMPFVGGIWAPNDRFFNQILLQFDRDVNGNLAYVNGLQDPSLRGRQLTQAGRSYYPTFMYASFGTGYWLYKNDRARFTGFSPVLEVHVNQAFEDFEPIHFQGYQLGQNPGVVSVTNALIGCNFEWGTRSTLSFAYVTPLGGGTDRFFDGELRALYNWRFGPQNRLTRAQF